MKKIIINLIICFLLLFTSFVSHAQVYNRFPFDPYTILKTWTYDQLVAKKGSGEQIVDTLSGQAYIAGLRYPQSCLGKEGILDFYFQNEDVSRIQFRYLHPAKPLAPDFADQLIRDSALSRTYAREVIRNDSLRTDSILLEISGILGNPITSGRTSPTDKQARYSATWINCGYSCMFKDNFEVSEIIFTIPKATSWVRGEFDINPATEIVQRTLNNSKKMKWTTTLLAEPSDTGKLTYKRLVLLLEYSIGATFAEDLPDIECCYLPSMNFDDTNGTAIEDAIIKVPVNAEGSINRHYIYSLQLREPILVFNTNDFLPTEVRFISQRQLEITMSDGFVHLVAVPASSPAGKEFDSGGTPIRPIGLTPTGYSKFISAPRNRDGSLDFIGTITLYDPAEKKVYGYIEIYYQFATGGWDVKNVQYLGVVK